MGTTRKRTGKTTKTPAKRTVRKKKPKVQLKTKSVVIMACSIIGACIVILGVSYLFSRASSSQMSQTAWKKAPAGQPIMQAEDIRELGEPTYREEKKNVATTEDTTETSKKTDDKTSKAQKESKVKEITIIEPDVAKEVKKNAPQEQVESKVETQSKQDKTEKTQEKSQVQQQSQSTQKETQDKTKTQQTQTQVQPKVQQQDKIASVTVSPQPQIQEIPKKLFDVPLAKPGAKICFVIDDAGLHASNVKRYTSLPFPITIAVLPKLAQSSECAQAVRSAGKELILHQPMQAHDYASGTTPNPGPGAILPGMDTYEIAKTVKANIDSLGGGVKGVNNHEGSLVTENYIQMGAVLTVTKERGIYFLDSRTTSQSSVPDVASSLNLSYLARYAPFLDNEINRSSMLQMIYKGLEVANKNGYAVMIGHVDKSVDVLPQLLSDIYPYLVQAGYTVTVPSRL